MKPYTKLKVTYKGRVSDGVILDIRPEPDAVFDILVFPPHILPEAGNVRINNIPISKYNLK